MTDPLLVLGTGQLGLMMAQAGAALGISVDRLDVDARVIYPGTSSYAVPVTPEQVRERYRRATVEREDLLEHPDLSQWAPNLADESVGWAGLGRRDWQKSLLDSLGLATSPWCLLARADDLERAQADWGGVVIKRCQGGYDGRGQWQLRDGHSVTLPDDVYGSAIVEAMIDFTAEVSLMGARTRDGQCVFYPLTRNWHDQGILRVSHAPADVAPALQQQAESMLATLMNAVNYVGVMGMECFVSTEGLLINEIAPRVHNSGHWTQCGADLDQFALHVRAHCDLPVHAPRVQGESLMVNLIGHALNPTLLDAPGVDLHWYGKDVRPGRKLGHINMAAPVRPELLVQARSVSGLLDAAASATLDQVLLSLDLR